MLAPDPPEHFRKWTFFLLSTHLGSINAPLASISPCFICIFHTVRRIHSAERSHLQRTYVLYETSNGNETCRIVSEQYLETPERITERPEFDLETRLGKKDSSESLWAATSISQQRAVEGIVFNSLQLRPLLVDWCCCRETIISPNVLRRGPILVRWKCVRVNHSTWHYLNH